MKIFKKFFSAFLVIFSACFIKAAAMNPLLPYLQSDNLHKVQEFFNSKLTTEEKREHFFKLHYCSDDKTFLVTTLTCAILWERYNIAEYILSQPWITKEYINMTYEDDYNWTALHAAIDKGHTSLIKILIDRGANPNIQTKTGLNCFSFAKEKGLYEFLLNTKNYAVCKNCSLIYIDTRDQSRPEYGYCSEEHYYKAANNIMNCRLPGCCKEYQETRMSNQAGYGYCDRACHLISQLTCAGCRQKCTKTPIQSSSGLIYCDPKCVKCMSCGQVCTTVGWTELCAENFCKTCYPAYFGNG